MKNNKEYNGLEDDLPSPEVSYADLYEFMDYRSANLILVWGENINKNKQVIIKKNVSKVEWINSNRNARDN